MSCANWLPKSRTTTGPVAGSAACRSSVRAVRRRRVERRLEIGLDLGVVGREDAVAGVGRLAVDRLAALLVAGWAAGRPALLRLARLRPGRLRHRRSALPRRAARRRQCTGTRTHLGRIRARAAAQSRLRIASAAIAM